MAELWINETDVQTAFGFTLADEGTVLSAGIVQPGEVSIPGSSGTLFVGPGKIAGREFTVAGQVHSASGFAATRTALIGLKALATDGQVTVRLNGSSTIVIEAVCVAFEADNVNPSHVIDWIDVKMTFKAQSPYWRDLAAVGYTFDANLTPMPMGNADVWPDYWVYGPANVPVLTGYDAWGSALWTATININLAATDSVRIVTTIYQQAIYKYVNSATPVLDNTLLSAGVFPQKLRSAGAMYTLAQWPMLKTSLGVGKAVYARNWK